MMRSKWKGFLSWLSRKWMTENHKHGRFLHSVLFYELHDDLCTFPGFDTGRADPGTARRRLRLHQVRRLVPQPHQWLHLLLRQDAGRQGQHRRLPALRLHPHQVSVTRSLRIDGCKWGVRSLFILKLAGKEQSHCGCMMDLVQISNTLRACVCGSVSVSVCARGCMDVDSG